MHSATDSSGKRESNNCSQTMLRRPPA